MNTYSSKSSEFQQIPARASETHANRASTNNANNFPKNGPTHFWKVLRKTLVVSGRLRNISISIRQEIWLSIGQWLCQFSTNNLGWSKHMSLDVWNRKFTNYRPIDTWPENQPPEANRPCEQRHETTKGLLFKFLQLSCNIQNCHFMFFWDVDPIFKISQIW